MLLQAHFTRLESQIHHFTLLESQ